MKKKLNGKVMEVKMKFGWTIADFAEHFECTEEEFLQMLQKQFRPKVYKDMLSDLRRNEGRKKRAIKSLQTTKKVRTPKTIETQNEKCLEEKKDDVEDKKIRIMLDELSIKESDIKKEICDRELLRNNLVSEKDELRKSLEVKREEILRIKKQVLQVQTDIASLIISLNKVNIKSEQIGLEISQNAKLLEETQRKRRELEQQNLYGYNREAG